MPNSAATAGISDPANSAVARRSMTSGEELDRQEYLAERKLLLRTELGVAKTFDKAILTLSAGALALSITFLHEVAAKPPVHKSFLYWAWSLMLLALLLNLFSFLLGMAAMRRQRAILDDVYLARANHAADPDDANRPGNAVRFLNWSSAIMFVLGVLLFALFCSTNV